MPIYYHFKNRQDGFGAQFQSLIYSIVFCEYNKLNFIYRGISNMEHNYDNDPNYINEIEALMNIKNNYTTEDPSQTYEFRELPFKPFLDMFDKKLDYYLSTSAFQRYKQIFWSNKTKHNFNNGKYNVAVHIRRYCMPVDIGCGRREVPVEYFANIINTIRNAKPNALFHIYSVGDVEYFKPLMNHDIVLHINENITTTFVQMVSADGLVTSRSSMSYVAGLLSDGHVYYIPFWHPPKSNWYVIS